MRSAGQHAFTTVNLKLRQKATLENTACETRPARQSHDRKIHSEMDCLAPNSSRILRAHQEGTWREEGRSRDLLGQIGRFKDVPWP